MIDASQFLKELKKYAPGLFCAVPCSLLKPLINHVIIDPDLQYINAVSEGEAVGIAAGSSLTGKTGVVLLQNSGLGNTINPITSLINVYKIPTLLVVSHRGKPGTEEAAQHRLMGKITKDLLTMAGVFHETFPGSPEEIEPVLRTLFDRVKEKEIPVALVVERGMMNDYNIEPENNNPHAPDGRLLATDTDGERGLPLSEAVRCVAGFLTEKEAVISATGDISRNLFNEKDRPANFYMQGSMGTTAAIGLGISLTEPKIPVIVLDGDGSLLMRMGSLATVGYHQPEKFIHIVLDNSCYGTTGGQPSASSAVSFTGISREAGYRRSVCVANREQLCSFWEEFRNRPGPSMIHVKIAGQKSAKTARPSLSPVRIKERFMQCISRQVRKREG